MTTPIIMLTLMAGPYLGGQILSAFRQDRVAYKNLAAIGLTLLFTFTGVGHFILTDPMTQMLPPWVPFRTTLIFSTGILELVLAAGFLLPKFRPTAGWVTAILLVLFFPANVYAAVHHIPMGGHAWGPSYLLIRAPLQLIMLFWVYWFTIRESSSPNPSPQSAGLPKGAPGGL
jgi:uncharacterized membrane protein